MQISLDAQTAPVAAKMLDGKQSGVGGLEPVSPFDKYRTLIEQLLKAEAGELPGRLDPVQVDVGNLDAPLVDTDKLKGRARHVRRRSGASSHASHERRLARAEIPLEEQQIALLELAPEVLAGSLCLRGGVRDDVKQSGRSPRGSDGSAVRPGRRP